MIEIRRVWKHAGEAEAVHLMLTSGDDERHVKLKRSGNPAMYDFIMEHGAIPTDGEPDADPETQAN